MRVLITGAAGIVGSEVAGQLRRHSDVDVVRTMRHAPPPDGGPPAVSWVLGEQAPPESLRGPWDVIVHTAASTRWTMTRQEATQANIDTLHAALALADRRTRFVQVSTAYASGPGPADPPGNPVYDGFRNGYEWSKAMGEAIVADAAVGDFVVVRPPLILGRRATGVIGSFSGPYTLFQALVSGLAPAVVGDPDGFVEVAPVDEVAAAIVTCCLRPGRGRTEVVAAGGCCLSLRTYLLAFLDEVNDWRAGRGCDPVAFPPIIDTERWNRLHLPLVRKHLSPMQQRAVSLLEQFEAYTAMRAPFTPDFTVHDPAEVVRTSTRWWADAVPRRAGHVTEEWLMTGDSVDA